jgi:hypothetical protein
MNIAITTLTIFALITGFGSAQDEQQSSPLLRGATQPKHQLMCNAPDGPLSCMAKQKSGSRDQRLSACCGAFGNVGYICTDDVFYCCTNSTLPQFNDGSPTTIGKHTGCNKVEAKKELHPPLPEPAVPHPPLPEPAVPPAAEMDSFMKDFDSAFVEVAEEGQQPKHKKLGACGLDAQAEWAKHPNKYAEEKERCMCMNQKCCGGYNKCEKNRATCTNNGFNCVQQSSLEDIFVDVMASNVCDGLKYANICAVYPHLPEDGPALPPDANAQDFVVIRVE